MSSYNLHLRRNFAPVVFIDSGAESVIIKLSENPVSSTLPLKKGEMTATLHLDSDQNLVALEILGIRDFDLKRLIEVSGIPLTEEMLSQAQYLRSETLPRVQLFPKAMPAT